MEASQSEHPTSLEPALGQQQQQVVQQATQQQQKLLANYGPVLEQKWANLLRALHEQGFPDPEKVGVTPHGEFEIEYKALGRGYLNVDAFLIHPALKSTDPEARVGFYTIPQGEVEPGWFLIHSGSLADVPAAIRKYLSIPPLSPPKRAEGEAPVLSPSRNKFELVMD